MDKEKHLTEAVPHRWGLLGWSYGNVRGKSGVESFCCPKDGSGRRNDSKEHQRLFVRNWSQGPHRAHLEENAINVTKVGIIIGWNYTPVTLKELTPKRNLVNIMCVVKILRKKKSKPTKHRKVHTGEKSYNRSECSKCEKTFISKPCCSVHHRTQYGGRAPKHVVYVRNPSAMSQPTLCIREYTQSKYSQCEKCRMPFCQKNIREQDRTEQQRLFGLQNHLSYGTHT